MALRWSDITIFHDKKPWQGATARQWVGKNLAALLVGDDARSSVVILHVGGGALTGHAALAHLTEQVELLGGRLHSRFAPPPRRAVQPPVRRQVVNVLRPPPPTYSIELLLGNIDALFAPIGGGDPWTEVGVQQRLQALGYLYTPLGHPRIAVHAQACWGYYKRVHAEADNVAAKARLVREINGNLLARAFPGSGAILAASALPAPSPDGIAPEENAILRFPGAYTTTRHTVSQLTAGDHKLNGHALTVVPGKYLTGIGDPRHLIELQVALDNPVMGKLPLLARVTATYADGRVELVRDAPVHFQLRPPTPLPVDSPFLAPPPPTKVMNYDLEGTLWTSNSYPSSQVDAGGLTEPEWTGLHQLTTQAFAQDPLTTQALADQWIDTWAAPPAVPWVNVQGFWGDVADLPYGRLSGYDAATLKAKMGGVLTAVRANAAAPRPMLVMRLSFPEWSWVARLALAALAAHGNDAALARPTAEGWIDTWAAAPTSSLLNVTPWWIAGAPYPSLRSNMRVNAKAAAGRILAARALGVLRAAEFDDVGQKKHIVDLLAVEEAKCDVADPQKKNAAAEPYGGRTRDAAGIAAVLETPAATRDGFHTPRGGQLPATGVLARAALPADVGAHPHAVACPTNVEGMAGVLFTPSRVGGDAYRIRAYIAPEWLQARAPAIGHRATAETGTMVVWRNFRINRYLRMATPAAGGYSPALTTTLNGAPVNRIGTPEYARMGLDADVATVPILPALPTEAEYLPNSLAQAARGSAGEKMMYRPVRVTPHTLKEQLAWAYGELIADCAGVEAIDDAIRTAAAVTARAAMTASNRIVPPVSWDDLIFVDHTSPFLLNLRGFDEYNALVAARGFTPLGPNIGTQDFSTAMDWAWEAIAEELSGGGVLPGLTLIQFPRGDTWDFRAINVKTTITSGYGTAARAAFLSHTEGVYRGFFAYPATANALHELGHVLGLAHQVPAGADLLAAHQSPVATPFTRPDVAAGQAVCLMSYSGCYGDYCGHCILALRGFHQTHVNTL
jgi:hypothetical protein